MKWIKSILIFLASYLAIGIIVCIRDIRINRKNKVKTTKQCIFYALFLWGIFPLWIAFNLALSYMLKLAGAEVDEDEND